MESLEPLINLIVLLTVLSVAAERTTNVLKLRRDSLRVKETAPAEEKKRERSITGCAVLVGIFVALFVKADLFSILSQLDNPWSTLGWIQVQGSTWTKAAASQSWGTFGYSTLGCIITGVALGFGSKFWHDVLDAVFELRGLARKLRGA